MEDLSRIIHKRIMEAWELSTRDEKKKFFFNEHTFQSNLYHHLILLLEEYYMTHDIRVWCEYPIGKSKIEDESARIDIVIVKIKKNEIIEKKMEAKYLIKEVYALIELKYSRAIKLTKADQNKLGTYYSILYPDLGKGEKTSSIKWTEEKRDIRKYVFGIKTDESKDEKRYIGKYCQNGKKRFIKI